jgi:hypothetical protein
MAENIPYQFGLCSQLHLPASMGMPKYVRAKEGRGDTGLPRMSM